MTTKNEAIHNAQSAMEYTLRALDNGNDLTYAKSCLQGAITAIKQALPEQASRMIAPAYGIIDPDYARVFTQARIVAWQYGYACVMHGSFTRDLDLLLVPWTDTAIGNEDQLLKLIAQGCGLRFIDCKEEVVFSTVDWSEKPHGRKACSLYFPAFGDRRWIDISIFTKPQAHQAQEPTWTDGCTEENCLRCKTHPKHRGNMQHAGIGSYPPAPKQAEPAWQPIETAPFGVQLLVTAEFDGPNDWRIKVGDKDAHGHWIAVSYTHLTLPTNREV